MSDLPSPGDLLRAYGKPAKKSLGQNFLTDVPLLDKIIKVAGVGPESRVLEIGPGPGGLTVRLLASGAEVLALEKDPACVQHLQAHLGAHPRFRVVEADALGEGLAAAVGDPPRVVVGNLPYHVATPILFALLGLEVMPRRLCLMFQKEVADRIVVTGRDRNASALGVGVAMTHRAQRLMVLPPGAFTPAPKVHSAVLLLEARESPLATRTELPVVRRIVQAAFGQRRKTLRNALKSMSADVDAWLERAKVDPRVRPEDLDAGDYVQLARSMASHEGVSV